MKRRDWLLALGLFLLNLWLVHELLGVEYLAHMGSIEGSRIALGRWILENWRDLSWFPLWYGGVPFPNTYPPLGHALVAGLAALSGISPAHAYHALIAVFYALGPVTLFWLALRISRDRVCALATALLYSLLSPSAFTMPSVARDLGSLWGPRRLQTLVLYGEGPHGMALALLPLALLLIWIAWEKRRPLRWMAAVAAVSSVALTNWLGAAELCLAVGAWLLSSRTAPRWKQWLWTAGLAACAAAIASPWIPPGTAASFFRSEDLRSGAFGPGVGVAVALGAVGLGAVLWALRRFRLESHIRFAVLLAYPPLLLTLIAAFAGPGRMEHAMRFQLLLEMGIALLAGIGLGAAFRRLTRRWRLVAAALLLVACAYPAAQIRRYAQRWIQPVEIGETVEYQQAEWLERNLPGERVFVSGSTRFILNAFADVPQFGGGFDPGATNPLNPAVQYQVLSGENAGAQEGEVAVLWLRAFGIGAIAVGGPRSREFYKDFRNPRKFEGLLPELWREGDDVIHGVPRRSRSLAHVIRPGDLPARRPDNGIDIDPVKPYVDALEDASLPVATFRWESRHSAVISTSMEPDQILSVQISYHPGWKALVNGESRRVYGDNLGQLAIEPGCAGPCTVRLHYDSGAEGLLTLLAAWLAVAGGLIWTISDTFRHFRQRRQN